MSVDHVSLPVPFSQFDAYITFLSAALAPLGIKEMMRPAPGVVGMGSTGAPFLWVSGMDVERRKILDEGEEEDGRKGCGGRSVHLALAAKNRQEVDDFHAAALKAGAKDNGAAGVRKEYHPNYYGAFVIDPAGHNLEAVIHTPA